MKATIGSMLLILFSTAICAQQKETFSLAANFGMNGSFFVTSLDNSQGPQGYISFNEKNFIGKVGGLEGRFHLNEKSHLTLGFTHSENKREYVYEALFNNVQVYIYYFTLRHMENIFHLGYGRELFRNMPGFRGEAGIFYSRQIQQSIELYGNVINIGEGKYNPGRFNELGAFIGIQYSRKIDTKFELGIQSRLFYEITSDILSQITLTPTLTYHFSPSKKKTKTNP